MTSRERRKQRRRDDHEARKEAIRNSPQVAAQSPFPLSEELDFETPELFYGPTSFPKPEPNGLASKPAVHSEIAPAPSPKPTLATDHTERNRKNAQLSTGPKTTEGKSQSSKNAFRHGLATNQFLVLPWESLDEFDELLDNLRAEHQPATQTEILLVEKMAEHFWLAQRALRLQDMCFHSEMPVCDQPKDLALYLRYQTTHDRAFHKCLTELAKLRAEQSKAEAGFVSQKLKEAAEVRKQQIHAARMAALTSNKSSKEQIRKSPAQPLATAPGASAFTQPEQHPSFPPQHPEASASVFSKAA